MLDDSLTSACFLNNMGDLVVGFQKQVFFIDHSKVCPQLITPESDVDTFDKESFICEDPAVMYEGVSPNPDPVTLNNYLVPFDIEFSKDFLEGRVKLEPEAVKEEESDDESAHSQAPTEIYLSPTPTPRRRLSLIDLTLGSGVTHYELLNHMTKTMEHLTEKEQADAAQLVFELKQEEENQEANRRRRRLARMRGSVDKTDAGKTAAACDTVTDGDKDGAKASEEQTKAFFSFPQFGKSPGPTPRSTPSGTPEVMSEAGESEPEEDIPTGEAAAMNMVTMQVNKADEEQEDEISKFLAAEKEKEKESEDVKMMSPRPKRKFGFSSVTVDAKTLMKDGKKTSSSAGNKKSGLDISSPSKAGDSDSDTGEKKGKRSERGSKKMVQASQRKTPKHRKPEKEIQDALEPPPTQMQALEQKEQHKTATVNDDFSDEDSTDLLSKRTKTLEGKRRPLTEFQEPTKIDKDVKRKKSQVDEKDTVDGRDAKVKVAAQNLKEPSLKNEVRVEETLLPEVTETVLASSKPGSAKSRLSSAKYSSDQGAALEDGGSQVSSQKVIRQSQTSPSIIGERSVEVKSDVGTKSGVVESFEQDGRKSVLSTEGSEDSKTAFRLSLLTKEPCVEETVTDDVLEVPASSVEKAKEHPAQVLDLEVNKTESFVRDCHRDSMDGKQGGQLESSKKPPSLKLKRTHLKPSSDVKSRSAQGIRGSQSKTSLVPGSRTKHSKPKADLNPEDMLSAYFEKQKAKEISRTTPHVLSINEAEELLKAVGRKKPPSPILEDEGAEEEEKNQTEIARNNRPSLDWTSGKVLGSRSSTTPSIPDTLSKLDFAGGRTASPDSSTIRATTPSVSIIENESVWSASSPAPSIGRGFSSPLPTLAEIPLASSPIPAPKLIIEGGADHRTNVDLNSSHTEQTDEDKAEVLQKNLGVNERGGHLSTISVSSISMVAESAATSSQKPDEQISRETSSLQSREDIHQFNVTNLQIDLNEARTETGQNANFEAGDEGVSISSSEDEGNEEEKRFDRKHKHKTVPSPVEKVDIVRRQSSSELSLSTNVQSSVANTIPEEDENLEANSQDLDDPLNMQCGFDDVISSNQVYDDAFRDRKDLSDVESSERTWDSDFDASYLGSVGELSSSLPASDEDSKANSRGGGSASSSSNTEQLMKVRIRKKQLSHHRQRRPDRALQQQQTPSPRDPSIALRRVLSQNDALTVQRNAQIGRARFERKRIKSAAEDGGGEPGAEKKEHISQCVLCAAEGSGQHAEHSKSKYPAAVGHASTEKEKRRISFKDEAKHSSSKPSPRLPRSGRSSVSLQSPREIGSRRSSLTQPSPREKASRRSTVTQPSLGGSDARRVSLDYRSPSGKKGSRQRTEDEGRLSKTPDISSKDQCWICSFPKTSSYFTSGNHPTVAPIVSSDHRPSATPEAASTRDRTTPTSIETPELSGYVRPPSQILSDAVFASPRESEAFREGLESVSEMRSTAPDFDGVGTPDSAWMDQDIISVSRQHVRSADQHLASSDLEETSDFHGGQSGLGMMSQDGRHTALDDVIPEVKVRSRPNTSVEDRALQKPELQNALTFFKQRPHTAQVRFKTELELIMELPKSHKVRAPALSLARMRTEYIIIIIIIVSRPG
ncbi:WD repeat-containing protein 87 [Elysia marginata]|uniref:WD repeat-containing protein 87 n=1 Tax=Elysia marginata TaxID=1093978 RepID=A0AAV4H2P8_9GAST|nr:WD repeat-containing protein 87 [Elysia marginata]